MSRSPRAGFTLIELLAAMSVLALLLILLAQIFAQTVDAWEGGVTRATRNSGARAAMELLARELEHAVVNEDFGFLKKRYDVSGWPINYDSLYFVTEAGTPTDGRVYQQVYYKVVRDKYSRDTDGKGGGQYYTTRLSRFERDFTEDPTRDPTASDFFLGRTFSGQWWKEKSSDPDISNASTTMGFQSEAVIEDVVRFDVYLYSGDPGNFGKDPIKEYPGDLLKSGTFDSHDDAQIRYPYDKHKLSPYIDIYLQVTSPEVMKRVDAMRGKAGVSDTKIEELLDRNSNIMYKRIYPRFQ